MKSIVSLVMMLLLMLTGCKTGTTGDPKEVLIKFFAALTSNNIEEAKKYVTRDSEGMMNMMQMGMQKMGDKSSQMAAYEKENIELGTPVIEGDKATVPVKDKKSGESIDFSLHSENGAWKVAFDFSTLMGIAQKKMKEHGMGNLADSLGNSLRMNGGGMSMDSATKADLEEAKKMMDSAGKMNKDDKNK
jgi:hypothetical protein